MPALTRLIRLQSSRLLLGVGFFYLTILLTPRCGASYSLVAVSILAGTICTAVAGALRASQVGQVSFVNRVAPIVLPLGFNIGRGKLAPVVVCSWLGWTLVAAAAAMHAMGFVLLGSAAIHAALTLRAFTIATLIVDGGGIFYLVTNATKYMTLRSPGMKSLTMVLSILLTLMLGSIVLWRLGWPGCGTVLSAAPPVVMLVFFSSYFAVAHNQRFN